MIIIKELFSKVGFSATSIDTYCEGALVLWLDNISLTNTVIDELSDHFRYTSYSCFDHFF
ncbi:hypothetical protein BKP35_08660 [Anaerobacillus arseniciselenatis]|uniref:Uncharacterized protein n=1 Tax=Anaerobacillus arseniciselenatis TaxID=85682 RepID=A0A1S2LQ67_9BACI|nr:hypothetical protein [Anaerobacillus arseniciselenatis]OIJ13837.1 hypothetical protein BKP35_08660 [Anaerobacillus arseniciselenatis]